MTTTTHSHKHWTDKGVTSSSLNLTCIHTVDGTVTQHTLCNMVLMCSPCRARWGTPRQQLQVITLLPTLKTAVL